jgi:hypothetical protein
MTTKRSHRRLSDARVCRLIGQDSYLVETGEGNVYSASGDPLKIVTHRGHRYVRLFDGDAATKIAVARVVWMAVVGEPPPEGFEVHHRDDNPRNDGWDNLLCVHKLDHKKLHETPDEEVPF